MFDKHVKSSSPSKHLNFCMYFDSLIEINEIVNYNKNIKHVLREYMISEMYIDQFK
jgi:hypothetical protein